MGLRIDPFGPRCSMRREVIKPYVQSPEEAAAAFAGVVGGPGIDVTDGKVSADLATDPGLEFDAAGDDGKVRVKADANRAMQRTADGVGLPTGGAEYDAVYVNAAGNWVVGILKLKV